MRSDQSLFRRTAQNLYIKNFEERTIGKKHILVHDFYILGENVCFFVINSCHGFNFRCILVQEQSSAIMASRRLNNGLATLIFIVIDAINPVSVFIKLVEAKLISHITCQRKKYGNAQ